MQNQKIPITVIITLLIQTVAFIWWLSKLDSRVQFHDKLIEYGLRGCPETSKFKHIPSLT